MYKPERERMANTLLAFRQILKADANINGNYPVLDPTADIFYNLIVDGNYGAVQLLLLIKPDLIYFINSSNNATPLHRASYFNKKEIVELFLTTESKLAYICDKDGKYPLEYAILERHHVIVSIFETLAPLDNLLTVFYKTAISYLSCKTIDLSCTDGDKYLTKTKNLVEKCTQYLTSDLPKIIAHMVLEFVIDPEIIKETLGFNTSDDMIGGIISDITGLNSTKNPKGIVRDHPTAVSIEVLKDNAPSDDDQSVIPIVVHTGEHSLY